ncbi:MAG: hypothetical protein AB7P02_16235 [Alphaproteobacteria bacterium]
MELTSTITLAFLAGLGFEVVFNAGWDYSYELYRDMFWAARVAPPPPEATPIETLSDYQWRMVPVDDVDPDKLLVIEYK